MPLPRVATLAQVPPDALDAYGGKAVHLAALRRSGFPVPEALVVHADAGAEFARAPRVRAALEQARSLAGFPEPTRATAWDHVRLRIRREPLPEALKAALREALPALGAPPFPLAVRSSASTEDSPHHSFAGIYRSELDVRNEDALWDAIRACWSSLWTLRAVEYRQRAGLGDREPCMALILQRMVPAEVAGVAFSRDPVSREARVVINAVRGLGEALVSGYRDPERYVIPREPALDAAPGSPALATEGGALLTPAQATDLAAHVAAIERVFGGPQDVEWALHAGRWWFVQTRPITTVQSCHEKLDSSAAPTPVERRPWGQNVWSNANVGEVLPGVTLPLTASGVLSELPLAFWRNLSAMGASLPRDALVMGSFAGRFYFNLALIQWYTWQTWGTAPDEATASMGGNQPAIPLPSPRTVSPLRQLGWKMRQLRAGRRVMRAMAEAPGVYVRADSAATRDRSAVLDRLSDLELLDLFFAQRELFFDLFRPFMLVSSGAFGMLSVLGRLAERWRPGGGAALTAALVAGRGEITSAEHGYELVRLAETARGEPAAAAYLRRLLADTARRADDWRDALAGTETLAAMERFLERYGHRAVVEWELAVPRWEEDPTYLLQAAAGFLDAPPASERAPDGEAAARAIKGLPRWKAAVLRALADRYARCAALREAGKSTAVKITAASRRQTLELGRRLAERGVVDREGDVFYLERGELDAFILGEMRPDGLRALVGRRREQVRAWQQLSPPPVIFGDEWAPAEEPDTTAAPEQREWHGLGVSGGRAEGRARVLLSPAEGHRLRQGEVLVAPFTDPAWTPLFLRASALVLEIGGLLSHGAIVAREYGLPAVANLADATRRIPDGAWVIVDGNRGEVHVR